MLQRRISAPVFPLLLQSANSEKIEGEAYVYRLETGPDSHLCFFHSDQPFWINKATLHGTDLSGVSGLTQTQLDTACVYEQTKLPTDLTRPPPCETAKKKNDR